MKRIAAPKRLPGPDCQHNRAESLFVASGGLFRTDALPAGSAAVEALVPNLDRAHVLARKIEAVSGRSA